MRVISFKNPAFVLFITQLFSTISFAVLYSSLVLFMSQRLHFSAATSTAIMGVFLAFNYGLHLLGGYMGGRLMSYRLLFIIGMLFQVLACCLLAFTTVFTLYLGLAIFLTASGLNVPCINMMLTQQFEPTDHTRETAFLWNYAGMNVGFVIGFSIAGFYQLSQSFSQLFVLSTVTNIIAFLLILAGWRCVADRNTPLIQELEKNNSGTFRKNTFLGFLVIFAFIGVIFVALQKPFATDSIGLAIGILIMLMFLVIAFKQNTAEKRNRVLAYVLLSVFGLIFWSLYQMAPVGLTLFAQHNVDRHVLGMTISPQWFQNINAVILAVGGPTLPFLLRAIRKRFTFSVPSQFGFSLFFVAVGFLLLPLGIMLANSHGYTAAIWFALSYVFQSFGELFIGPIGYAMVGRLATPSLQGLMMGSWMLIAGSTSGIIASLLSASVVHKSTSIENPLTTNSSYFHLFLSLGLVALVASVILFAFVPFLRRLIGIKEGSI